MTGPCEATVDQDRNTEAEWDQSAYWHRQADGPPVDRSAEARPATRSRFQEAFLRAAAGVKVAVAGLVTVVVVALVVASLAWGSGGRPPTRVPPAARSADEPPLAGQPLIPVDPGTPNPTIDLTSPSASAQATPRPTHTRTPTRSPSGSATTGSVPRANPAPSAPAGRLQVFQLVSRVSGLPIGVSGGSTANRARIVQVSNSDSSAQQWTFVAFGSGFLGLINGNSGKALDNTGSLADGTQLQQLDHVVSNRNQEWQFVSVGGGYFLIINRQSGRAIDLREGETAYGTAIQQWEADPANPNQHWRIVLV